MTRSIQAFARLFLVPASTKLTPRCQAGFSEVDGWHGFKEKELSGRLNFAFMIKKPPVVRCTTSCLSASTDVECCSCAGSQVRATVDRVPHHMVALTAVKTGRHYKSWHQADFQMYFTVMEKYWQNTCTAGKSGQWPGSSPHPLPGSSREKGEGARLGLDRAAAHYGEPHLSRRKHGRKVSRASGKCGTDLSKPLTPIASYSH